jgi:hypothetical protein
MRRVSWLDGRTTTGRREPRGCARVAPAAAAGSAAATVRRQPCYFLRYIPRTSARLSLMRLLMTSVASRLA